MGRRGASPKGTVEPEFPIVLVGGGALTVHTGETLVTCWCEARYLRIPQELILAGLTGSCGRPDCRPTTT